MANTAKAAKAAKAAKHSAASPTDGAALRPVLRPREIVLAAIALLAVVAAAVGFSLYGSERVPASAAAKVDDTYIAEADVAEWIAQYRTAYSLTDDADFASALLSQNMNVSSFRQSAINQLALNALVNALAEELDVEPTDEDVQAQLDATKEAYALGDDEMWAETMDTYGLTEDGLREQYRTNLARDAVCRVRVEYRDADDEELLAYMQDYLAGTTQKHVYRIVFTGDDANARAIECLSVLEAAAESEGGMSVETFSAYATEYSDEEDVGNTGGSYAWSGGSMDDEIKEILEYLDEGELSGLESIEADNATEILFCDSAYTFASASSLTSLPEDVPDELMDEVRDAASEELWSDDCDTYLASLLAAAKITYYPIPDDAAYNVDMSLAD